MKFFSKPRILRLNLLLVLFTAIRLCNCQDPTDPQITNPRPESAAGGTFGNDKQPITLTNTQWSTWRSANEHTIHKIGEQVNFFSQVRRTICPVGADPDRSTPLRDSLSFLLKSFRGLLIAYKPELNFFRGLLKLPQGEPNAGTLAREFGWRLDRSDKDALQQAKYVENLLSVTLEMVEKSYEFYRMADQEFTNWRIPGEGDQTIPNARYQSTYREKKIVEWAVDAKFQKYSKYDQTMGSVDINPSRLSSRIDNLTAYLSKISGLTDKAAAWGKLARDLGMDNRGYSKLMTPASRFDPSFKDRPRGSMLTVLELFDHLFAWYGCWYTPLVDLIKLLYELTPLPGGDDNIVWNLRDEPLTVIDNGYAQELLRKVLEGNAITRSIPSSGGYNFPISGYAPQGGLNNRGYGFQEQIIKKDDGFEDSGKVYFDENDIGSGKMELEGGIKKWADDEVEESFWKEETRDESAIKMERSANREVKAGGMMYLTDFMEEELPDDSEKFYRA